MARWLCLIVASAGIVAARAQSCDFGVPAADAPPELAEFAFLIGDHDVTLHAWTGDGWSPPRPVDATWGGRYGLDGHAIYDEWRDPDPARNNRGVNVRLYDPDETVWKMMWVATENKEVRDLRARVVDGVLTMWQVYPERPGWKAEFVELDAVRWARDDFVLDPATGDWTPQFRLVATRRPCAKIQSTD